MSNEHEAAAPGVDPEIVAHYEVNDEARRLASGHGLLERDRTREILRRFLPAAPAVVADIGGGAGVHSLWLADRGYEAHLVDPVPALVTEARSASARQPDAPIASCTVGDARRLPFDDQSCDAVLLMGPLYHLPDLEGRIAALVEAKRVVRAGGVVVAAAISRFASLLDGMQRELYDDPEFRDILQADLTDGRHRNPTGRTDYFTTAYFHRPEELAAEIASAGLQHEATLAVEGPAHLLADLDERLADPHRRDRLLDAIRLIENEPSMLGVSSHLLAVGRKP